MNVNMLKYERKYINIKYEKDDFMLIKTVYSLIYIVKQDMITQFNMKSVLLV